MWSGELAVTPKLNTEVITAFPVDPGARQSQARRLCHDRDAEGRGRPKIIGQLATQWFIVSDFGLTAFCGHDGIEVFVHSLASAAPLDAVRSG